MATLQLSRESLSTPQDFTAGHLPVDQPTSPSRLRLNDIQMPPRRELGRGGYGVVYHVRDRTGHSYALKVLTATSETASHLRAELLAVRRLGPCPNIVRSHEAFFSHGVLHILMELMDVGSLAKVLDKLVSGGCLPAEPLRCILQQTLQGLDFLHSTVVDGRSRPRLHRDVKPANILLNVKGQVKLSDFGCLIQSTNTLGLVDSFLGTKVYMSPERIEGNSYTTTADIWGFGAVAYECATGCALCPLSPFFDMRATVRNPAAVPSTVLPQLAGIITQCLQQDPTHRPSASELLAEGYFADPDPVTPLRHWLRTIVRAIQNGESRLPS